MGRKSKAAQLQAVRTKRLHTLHELNYIFLKGSMTALLIPFLKFATKMNKSPCVAELYEFVASSPNMKYQARFRFLLAVNFPCFVKRVGIRMNSNMISDGASALFMPVVFATNHNYYRDYYFLRYMNGKFVDCQESLSPEDPDISRFLATEAVDTKPNMIKFCKKLPSENIKFASYKAKYSYLTESTIKNDNHQGGDFIQEDALGRVSTFLKRGRIFDIEIFANAARRSQAHQKSEIERGNLCSNAKYRRPKYQNEAQSLAAVILNKQERPEVEDDLGEYYEDVIDVTKVGRENFKQYFKKKIRGVPTTQIKLRPAFITKNSFKEFNMIENKTKEVILEEIKQVLPEVVFEEENEKHYYEAKVKRSSIKKTELIDLYYDLKGRMIMTNLTKGNGDSVDSDVDLHDGVVWGDPAEHHGEK